METVHNTDKTRLIFAIERFNEFLDRLEQKGISSIVTQKAMNNLQKFMSQGIEPNMSQLFGKDAKAVKNAVMFGLSGAGDDSDTTANTTQDNGEVDWLDTVMNEVSSDGWFESTFGNVFGNGWDFSCWGASYSPSQAKEVAQAKIGQLAQGLGNPPTQASFDNWNKQTTLMIGTALVQSANGSFAKCTRDGYKLENQLILAYRTQVINAMKDAGYQFNQLQSNVLALTGDGFLDNWITQNAGAFQYNTYQLVFPANGGNINIPDGSTGGNTGGGAVVTGNGGNTGGGYSNASSGGVVPIVIGVGLLAGFLWNKYKRK